MIYPSAVSKLKNLCVLNPNHCCVLIFLSVLLLCLLLNDSEAREVGRIAPMSVHVSESFKCSKIIESSVHAPDRSHFSKKNLKFQRLVSTTGMTLGFQCPRISSLKIIGIVGGSPVYEGYSKKEQRWLLVQGTLQTETPVAQKEAPQTGIKKGK